MSGNNLIVSRHEAAIKFIREEMPEFRDAEVMASVRPDDVDGKVVAGNLPLSFAARALIVYAIGFDGEPPRGQEYSLADMRDAGAKLTGFTVSKAMLSTSREYHEICEMGDGVDHEAAEEALKDVVVVEPPESGYLAFDIDIEYKR